MTVVVASRGRITIPADARRRLGIRPGSRLRVFVAGEDRLEIVRTCSVKDLKHMLPKPRRSCSLKDIQAGVIAGALRTMR